MASYRGIFWLGIGAVLGAAAEHSEPIAAACLVGVIALAIKEWRR